MAWEFETDSDFQPVLDWVDSFVREEVEPLDFVIPHPMDVADPVRQELVPPLQDIVRKEGLWGLHLGVELGGPGFGQLKLALLNEILGRSRCAPFVFGCQAPDSGNAEILAHYGTPAQKERFLEPLRAGEIVSCFSMTEPQGGADPKVFRATAVLDGDEWVINGEKWFSSNARFASFFIVMVVTEPDAAPYKQQSMFLVPSDTPGIEILRNMPIAGQDHGDGTHAYMRYTNVRVPRENLLGERGDAFVVAQTRLGGGRIHHCMRAIGLVRSALDLMCERAVSRVTQGEMLGDKQLVQSMIADSWIELESFRLLVLRTAWRIDQCKDYREVRADISAVKAAMPRVLHDVAARALQVHGSLGVTADMPFMWMIAESFHMGLADGPTEVHKVTLAKQVLRDYTPAEGMFPSTYLPDRRRAAYDRYSATLARHGRVPA
jgi:acyl-CoA dehydrogenase